ALSAYTALFRSAARPDGPVFAVRIKPVGAIGGSVRLTAPGHRGAAPAPPDVHSNAGESLPHSTQPGEGTQNFRVVARDVADDDVGVAERRELGEPRDDLLDRARDEGRGGDSAIRGGQDWR